MGLEVVLNEILARGSEEEQKILRDAESERQKLLSAAEGEADELRSRMLQDTRHKVEALRREHQSATEFEVRRRLLTTQRELTEDFRRRLIEALRKLPKAEREKLLDKLAKKSEKELKKGTVHANRDDLAWLAKNAPYEKGAEIQTAGGFQVESEDATLLFDHRFETLLDNAWKDILAQTKALFEGT